MDKNSEVLDAFINWFMREYSNFSGKPISERYDEAFDTFNNDFIDARYDAFQDGWKAQQAKVEELHKISVALNTETIRQREQVTHYLSKNVELQKRVDVLEKLRNTYRAIADKELDNCTEGLLKHIERLEKLEQALKGDNDGV